MVLGRCLLGYFLVKLGEVFTYFGGIFLVTSEVFFRLAVLCDSFGRFLYLVALGTLPCVSAFPYLGPAINLLTKLHLE